MFVLATGKVPLADSPLDRLTQLMRIGSIAADCVARAVARGVFAASDLGEILCYQSRYVSKRAAT